MLFGVLMPVSPSIYLLLTKWRPASLAFGVTGGDEFNQGSPWYYLIYLVKEHLFAGFLGAEIEVQGSLLHGLYFLKYGLR